MVRRELNAEELQRLTVLIQEVVGYNEVRGDRVNVVSAPFITAEEIEAIDIAFYEQDWFWPTLKQAGGALLVLYLIFGVLKPSLKNLSNYRPPVVIHAADGEEGEAGLEGEVMRNEKGEIIAEGEEAIPLPQDHDNKVEFAQKMVEHDPRRVAKVVKEWVANG